MVKRTRATVELSNFLVQGRIQVAVHHHFHDDLALVSAQVRDDITTHQRHIFRTTKLIEAGQHHVGIRGLRTAAILIDPREHE